MYRVRFSFCLLLAFGLFLNISAGTGASVCAGKLSASVAPSDCTPGAPKREARGSGSSSSDIKKARPGAAGPRRIQVVDRLRLEAAGSPASSATAPIDSCADSASHSSSSPASAVSVVHDTFEDAVCEVVCMDGPSLAFEMDLHPIVAARRQLVELRLLLDEFRVLLTCCVVKGGVAASRLADFGCEYQTVRAIYDECLSEAARLKIGKVMVPACGPTYIASPLYPHDPRPLAQLSFGRCATCSRPLGVYLRCSNDDCRRLCSIAWEGSEGSDFQFTDLIDLEARARQACALIQDQLITLPKE